MNSVFARRLLAVSLLINLGVLVAVLGSQLAGDGLPMPSGGQTSLTRDLQLSSQQLQRWHDAEAPFLALLRASSEAIGEQRDRLIRGIFAAEADAAGIEAARMRIAELQGEQQRLVIEQLLREREILEPSQREQLASILLSQPVGPQGLDQLHR
jgi:Spy/CpxP family protein refolding chaperone